MVRQEPGVPYDKSGHKDHSNMPRYDRENTKPKQAKEGSTAGEYSANGLRDFNGEMMEISNGMYGKSGAMQDKARIAPYMMYNDTTDQNGY